MNERIKELYTQSLETKFDYGGGEGVRPGEYYSNYKSVLNAEKFAELIVRECAEVCASIAAVRAGYNDADGRDTADSCGDQIKEHFGVE